MLASMVPMHDYNLQIQSQIWAEFREKSYGQGPFQAKKDFFTESVYIFSESKLYKVTGYFITLLWVYVIRLQNVCISLFTLQKKRTFMLNIFVKLFGHMFPRGPIQILPKLSVM